MEDAKEFLEKYKREKGFVPKYYEVMAMKKPDMFRAFLNFRSEVLEEGSLPRKTKELILIATYAATRFDFGLEIHTKGAIIAGATEEEIFETLSLVLLTNGISGYITGINALEGKKNG